MSMLLETFRSSYSATQDEELSLDEYLDLCKRDPTVYATAAERMLAGIGEPEMVDTRNDQRLARLLTQPGQIVQHAGGKAGFVQGTDQVPGDDRRLLGGLQHQGHEILIFQVLDPLKILLHNLAPGSGR